MNELELLEKDIFETLNERRTISFLAGYRRTTEGMFKFLLTNLDIEINGRFELGSFISSGLLKKITEDININSDINYIRLYGNRASHSGNIFFDSDILLVNASYKRIVYFFYEKLGIEIPKHIKLFIDKLKVGKNTSRNFYNKDIDVYLNSIISVEQSDKDYPRSGLKLLGNIISKILIDSMGRVPDFLINKKNNLLNIRNSINHVKRNNLINSERVSQLEALYTFFSSSNQIIRGERDLNNKEINPPNVPVEIIDTLRDFTNWFYKIDTSKKKINSRRLISSIIDVITLLAFGATMFLGSLLFNWNGRGVTIQLLLVLGVGVLTFLITFLYNIFYPYVPFLQNRRLYTLSRSFTAITGTIGASILGLVTYWLLNDGKSDGKHLPFFIGAISWSIFIQLSLIVKSETNSKHDEILRIVSYILIVVIIGFSIWFSTNYDGR